MFWLTIVLAVLVGISLGLLGGGGSILTVPLLVYVAGQDAQAAIATSLLVVGVTSGMGAVTHARAGRVRWRIALLFGGAGMVGAFAGGRIGSMLPEAVLLVLFGALLLVTSIAMLWPRDTEPVASEHDHVPLLKILLHGSVVGVVTGMVGAGGGFLVVPALVVLGGLPMHAAVGTSLVVIAMKSIAGFAGYVADTTIDWPLALGVVAAASLGAVVAGRFANRIDAASLRRGFGWFVLAVGGTVLTTELLGMFA